MAFAALGALVATALGLALTHDFGREGFSAATRFTARWSYPFFVLAWSASSLTRLWPGGWRHALLVNRRGLGLGFAVAHLIHAGCFLTAILVFGKQASLVSILGGGLGYVFVFAMAATSNDWSVRKLGPGGWRLLHSVGGWFIAFIFAFTYFNRLDRDPVTAWLGLAPILIALGLRMAAAAKVARRQTA